MIEDEIHRIVVVADPDVVHRDIPDLRMPEEGTIY
jgi:hypothetical protein